MFATKHTRGQAQRDFHLRSGPSATRTGPSTTRTGPSATRKTVQRTSKASRSGPVVEPRQAPQIGSAAFVPASTAASIATPSTAPDAGKKLFLTRREQRKHDRKALRKLESLARFVDVPSTDNDDSTANAMPEMPERVSKAQALRFEQAQNFDKNEDAVEQEDDIRPIASRRDMKAKQRLVFKNSKKRRTIERRQDRA